MIDQIYLTRPFASCRNCGRPLRSNVASSQSGAAAFDTRDGMCEACIRFDSSRLLPASLEKSIVYPGFDNGYEVTETVEAPTKREVVPGAEPTLESSNSPGRSNGHMSQLQEVDASAADEPESNGPVVHSARALNDDDSQCDDDVSSESLNEALAQLAAARGELAEQTKRNDLLNNKLDGFRKRLAAQRSESKELEEQRNAARVHLRRAQRELAAVTQNLTSQQRAVSRYKNQVKKLQSLGLEYGPVSITDPQIRDWLCQGRNPTDLAIGSAVSTLGSGPFEIREFEWYLVNHGFDLCDVPHHEASILILGRDEWDEGLIFEQIEARSSEEIRVFSQELFVLALATGKDPFTTASDEVLRLFGENHPALSMLMDSDFEWPRYSDGDADGEFTFTAHGLSDISPLREMGYVVGNWKGLPVAARRSLLTKAFQKPLPWVTSNEYMKEWGTPGSRRRLWRIGRHLAWMATMHAHHPYAVDDWTEDLAWMKKQFYTRSMKFRWPTVSA